MVRADTGVPTRSSQRLLAEEQSVKRDGFSQCHTDDGLNENLTGCAGITANGFDSLCADETDANCGCETAECALDAARYFSDVDHSGYVFVGCIAVVRAESTLPTGNFLVGGFSVTILLVMIVTVIADQTDVDAHQEGEDKCLNKADEEFEEVKGDW